MAASLNWVDYCIIAVFGFSILAGLMRGLIKEVIAVVTWITAFILASLFADRLAAMFTSSPQVQSALQSVNTSMNFNATHSITMISVGISFMGIFVSTLIVGGIINYFISSAMEAGGISFTNRLLGGLFGLFRGALVNLILIFMVQLSPIAQQPAWLQSQFVKSYQPAIYLIYNWIRPNIDSMTSTVGQKIQSLRPAVPTFDAR